jgi:glycosyltransferase involved in cell wall biosynthesis
VRVLVFTTGPACEPSSRWRVFQFLPELRRRGFEVEVRPLAGRRYFELGYGLRRLPRPAAAAWAVGHFAGRSVRRVRDLLAARRFDVLWIQKETLPFGLEGLIPHLGLRVVYDFDDAVYVVGDGDRPDGRGRVVGRLAEAVLRRHRSLPALLERCETVVAGSPVLAAYAERHARQVTRIPTVVDTDVFEPAPAPPPGPATIGWIGAPPNAVYLKPLVPVLRALARRFDFRLVLIGPDRFACPGVRVECLGWRDYVDPRDEARDVQRFDVGIMPLADSRFAAGKCALKAIQYMACGIPVAASPVGVNSEVVRDGECGFLPRTPEEWEDRLSRLLADPELRRRLGARGRARAEEHYSVRSALPRLVAVLRGSGELLGRGAEPSWG